MRGNMRYRAVVGLTTIAESTSLEGAIFALWNVGGYKLGKVITDTEVITIYKGEVVTPNIWR